MPDDYFPGMESQSESADEIAMKERRAAARQRSFLQGRIYFNNRRSSIDCLVRDISDHGAKLKFSEAIAIPEVVELYIPNRDETFRARVQWRSGDEVGVDFGPDEAPSPSLAPDAPPADLAARVRRLESEVSSLQRKVAELQDDLRKRQGADI
jgi:PilZ domain